MPYLHYPIHELVELCEFSLREGMPAVRGPGNIAKTEEELPDFLQRETELPRALNDGQPIESCGVISSAVAQKWLTFLLKSFRLIPLTF